MADEAQAALAAGEAALRVGDWAAARTSFEAALDDAETAEAQRGLADTLWWLGDTDASVGLSERAYAGFRRRGDMLDAALVAIRLSLTYRASLGNDAAAQGWLGRAARLVEEHGLDPLEGWVLLCRAGAASEAGRAGDAEQWARRACEIARRDQDGDLELCALSEVGASLLAMGRIEEGSALLDEAMAGSLAGEGDLDTVVYTSCRTITSCSRAAEVKRATQWLRAADGFTRRYGCPHLYAICRLHHGSVLFLTGSWKEAEEELRAALRLSRSGEPALQAEALAKLAELRLAQGRVEEAERLLAGFDDRRECARALAMVKLARGASGLALALARRCLQEADADCLESGLMLELLVDAQLAVGDDAAALREAVRLVELAARLRSDLLAARGERAIGRALAARGDEQAARKRLEAALAAFSRLGMPLEAARARLLLARSLGREQRDSAVVDGRLAYAAFDRLGAVRDGDEAAALLRALGVNVARAGPRGVDVLSKREREVLALLGEGLSNRELAERLFLSRKTVEHHVHSVLSKLDLSSRSEAAAFAIRHLESSSASG